jgi:hypothetical protein
MSRYLNEALHDALHDPNTRDQGLVALGQWVIDTAPGNF